jgi:hypothetical protein
LKREYTVLSYHTEVLLYIASAIAEISITAKKWSEKTLIEAFVSYESIEDALRTHFLALGDVLKMTVVSPLPSKMTLSFGPTHLLEKFSLLLKYSMRSGRARLQNPEQRNANN